MHSLKMQYTMYHQNQHVAKPEHKHSCLEYAICYYIMALFSISQKSIQISINTPFNHFCCELGPFLAVPVTTLEKRLLYFSLLLALPVGGFGLSYFSTLGAYPLTFPARAKLP
eukprot:TRINITY_DN2921_c0_g1_i3.p2 TRINITY_DN2921_c0_g1~~TRINITY_DN2921_c0_g1_i3.p2  ORF type:complete len:113 (+),score=0.27 TRINITY_DN2921_c0_g1_i3:153-491(+)